jgi:hypothetical protein
VKEWKAIIFLSLFAFSSSAILSHIVAWGVGLGRIHGVQRAEQPTAQDAKPVISYGSSLMGYAINSEKLREATGWDLEFTGCAAGSPAEFEFLSDPNKPKAGQMIFTSIFEMSECMLSPSRTHLVPFWRSLQDTRDMILGWEQTKMLLWKYPLDWFQYFFPTLGRSWEIQVIIRDKLLEFLDRRGQNSSEEAPIELAPYSNNKTNSILSWDAGRMERNVAQMRQRNVLLHNNFVGPKSRALDRMLERGTKMESASIIVILPVSPEYIRRFVDAETTAAFERMLSELHNRHPAAKFIRLDQEPSLQKDDFFWDLVHINADGQKVATCRLIEQLINQTMQP